MNNKIFKYIKILSYVLLGLGVAAFVYFLVASITMPQLSTEAGFTAWGKGAVSGTNVMLVYTYILFALTLLLAVIFPVINIIKNPKGSMRSLLGLLMMIVVLGISLIFASGEAIVTPVDTFDNVFTLKMADMGLYAAYIMFVAAFVAIIFGELRNAFKK